MRARKIILTCVLLACILLAGACGKKNSPQDNPAAPAEPVKNSITAFGLVKAKEVKNITIDFPAALVKMGVQEGQLVVAGNVLAELDLSAYTAQIQSKEIELQMARLEMQKADLEMEKIKNEVKNAEQSYLMAINDLRRKEQLFKEGAIPEAELDIYKTTATEQEQALHNLQLDLQSSSTQDRQLLKGKIAKLEVELNQMKDRLQKPYLQGDKIIADVSKGVISDLGYQAGDQLGNGKKLFSLLDLSSTIVEADVPEEFIREVKVGAAAAIVPLADPGQTYQAKITAIGSKAIEKKGETVIPVELTLDQQDEGLLPGFNVDVEIFK